MSALYNFILYYILTHWPRIKTLIYSAFVGIIKLQTEAQQRKLIGDKMKVAKLVLNANNTVSFTAGDEFTMTIHQFYKALYNGSFVCDLLNVADFFDYDSFEKAVIEALTVKTIYVKTSQYLTVKTIRTICETIGLDFNVIEMSTKSKFKNAYKFFVDGATLNNAKDALGYIKSLGYKIITRDGQWQKEL